MRLTSAIAIYFLFLALSVFVVLPFGMRTTDEAGGERVAGQADSAPHRYRPGQIALRTVAVATVAFAAYYLNYVNGWITVDMLDVSRLVT